MPGFRSPEDRATIKAKKPSFTLIAECGSNHNGDLDRALTLIAHAANAGATHVKFQLWRPDLWYSKRAMPEQYDKVLELIMPPEWIPTLAAQCKGHGVGFLCTAFDELSLAVVEPYVEAIKIASGDINNVPLLRAAAETGKPILLSTGASTLDEVDVAARTLAWGAMAVPSDLDLTLLHCVSAYPTPLDQANLSAIKYLASRSPWPFTSACQIYETKNVPLLDVHIGYSDHTADPYAIWCAYCLGARVFEMHFDLVDGKGVETGHSITSDKLSFIRAGLKDLSNSGNYVTATERGIDPHWTLHFCRAVHTMVGGATKRPMLCELPERDWARRGIYTTRPVKEGEPLEGAIRALRPACAVGGGEKPISVSDWDGVVGGKADRDISGDMPITRGDAV